VAGIKGMWPQSWEELERIRSNISVFWMRTVRGQEGEEFTQATELHNINGMVRC
jgi:hypothetical protein